MTANVHNLAKSMRQSYLCCVTKNVTNNPHGGLGRVDVGIAYHELFQDVILDGP